MWRQHPASFAAPRRGIKVLVVVVGHMGRHRLQLVGVLLEGMGAFSNSRRGRQVIDVGDAGLGTRVG